MPFLIEKIEPVKEIQKIEIQPSIDKVENSSVASTEAIFIFCAIFVIYLLRAPLIALSLIIFKFIIIAIFVYSGYILLIQ